MSKITANNGCNLADVAEVGPVNLFLHSLFSQVDISLNGTLITPSTNNYPCRAMIETLASYGEDSKKSQLTSALFYKHGASKMVATTIAPNEGNEGLFHRRALAVGSREFDMMVVYTPTCSFRIVSCSTRSA